MRTYILTASLFFGTAGIASAACIDQPTCVAGNILTPSITTYRCDWVCGGTNGGSCDPGSFNACDQCGSGANDASPDGVCVICDDNDATHITGTANVDIICGSGGNDEIDGQASADKIEGGAGDDVLRGDTGDDQILGGSGANVIYGGTGDDLIHTSTNADSVAYGDGDDDIIWGSASDDTLYGGTGDDVLLGAGGADFLRGEDGNDSLSPSAVYSAATADGVIGNTYCGGGGNDSINAQGPAHVCVDAGSGSDTCQYQLNVTPNRSAGSFDIGTEIGCETIVSGYSFNSTREPDCGCE